MSAWARDLAWVMRSPNLLVGKNVVSESWCAEALKRLPGPDKIEEKIAHGYHTHGPTHRLGIYFETLVHYWLAEIIHVPVLHTNVQVMGEGRTLGEFDFLFVDPANSKTTHWETAIKFYLYSEARELYFGPAGNDRLDLKMKKIFEQQLPLSRQPEAAPIFERLGLHDVESKAFVKGMLFYPLESDWRTPPKIKGVSESHARGWWTHFTHDFLALANQHTRWRILEKAAWLTGGDTAATSYSRAELAAVCAVHFATSRISLMVAQLEPDASGTLTEQSRGFIAHKDWPFR